MTVVFCRACGMPLTVIEQYEVWRGRQGVAEWPYCEPDYRKRLAELGEDR